PFPRNSAETEPRPVELVRESRKPINRLPVHHQTKRPCLTHQLTDARRALTHERNELPARVAHKPHERGGRFALRSERLNSVRDIHEDVFERAHGAVEVLHPHAKPLKVLCERPVALSRLRTPPSERTKAGVEESDIAIALLNGIAQRLDRLDGDTGLPSDGLGLVGITCR